jgi:hypothetical protein
MVAGAFPCLHCRRIGREFAELIGRVGAHRRRARVAGARDGARELYHRLPIRHLQGQYNVVVSGRHIGAEQLSAQLVGHGFGGLESLAGLFCIFGALVSPV